jgi:UDP-N-acetylmuramoylalanine--D-glutamate ligase
MRISALEGRATAVWGYGREGRAALRALLGALPAQRFALICSADEAESARAEFGDVIDLHVGEPSLARLRRFEWIVKSPGISPYRGVAAEALQAGVRFTSGTALWFGEHQVRDPQAPSLCITASKGKSTTTALVAHLLRASGRRVALAGNIGLPLLELLLPAATAEPLANAGALATPALDAYVIELSSYQTGDAAAPDVAMLLNLYPEHLDWHGSEARYYDDKCALIEGVGAKRVVLNAESPTLVQRFGARADAIWFGTPQGWHFDAASGGILRGSERVFEAAELPLPGAHNARNLCAALAAIEALGIDARPLAQAARSFRPLPHRLQPLGERAGRLYVNDSISTTPHASLAALAHYRGRRVAILVGGHDRGLDWSDFVTAVRSEAPAVIVCMGANGPRIAQALRASGALGFVLLEAPDLPAAVAAAEAALDARASDDDRGVLLLSPGAPSFGEFRDYAERGRRFAALTGFDAEALGQIEGLGVA